MNFITKLFSSDGFMPHGHCYVWNPSLVELHVISDSFIFLAYMTIPVTLIYIVRRRKDIPFDWMLACFSVFILACGATHGLEIWTLWTPTYWLSGMVKAITAAASVATSILLVKLIPQLLAIPNPAILHEANAALREEAVERRRAEERLRESNAQLESRVAKRTAELQTANIELQRQISERENAEERSVWLTRKLGEEALRESEARYRSTLDRMMEGCQIIGHDWRCLYVNEVAAQQARRPAAEFLGRTITEIHSGIESTKLFAVLEHCMNGLPADQLEHRVAYSDGTIAIFQLWIQSVPEGVFVLSLDITKRKEAEARLRESEERFRGAFENSAVGMALVSPEGQWLRVNRALCAMVGRTEEELKIRTFQDITHPEDIDADLAYVRSLLAGEIDHYQMEKRYFHKEGHVIWVFLAVTLVRGTDGQPLHFVSQVEDITERHETAQRMKTSLEEKEVLLREIHHRVKNNMQVITSLLQLQSSYLRDPEDAAIFKECQARIHAMGLVHDRLYRSRNLTTIDFSEHLRDLTALIIRGQSNSPERIRLVLECEPIDVNLDTAIPLGLITAELISNAYKHAFRERASGVINVRLARAEGRMLTLTVQDDGVGLPHGFETEKTRSLGLRLIRALSGQLRADLSISSSDSGSKLQLSFSI